MICKQITQEIGAMRKNYALLFMLILMMLIGCNNLNSAQIATEAPVYTVVPKQVVTPETTPEPTSETTPEPTATPDPAWKELTEDIWKCVTDGDEYVLFADGTGQHGNRAVTFSFDQNSVSIIEGISSVKARRFIWDRESAVPRLIPDGENIYYVRSRDYEYISARVREESIQILLSFKYWKHSSATAYLQFLEGGKGWFIMRDNADEMKWEMIDNNTVKVTIIYNGYSTVLDIYNDNGVYRLDTGKGIYYTPRRG